VSFSLCAGAAYVFSYSDVYSAWSQEQKLTASDAAGGDFFGHSVSMYGDVIAVGCEGTVPAGGLYRRIC
jgi:hypothetical protein